MDHMSQQWWYCMRHSTVEGEDGCANIHRMGPYASQDEAARALRTAADKSEAWEQDERWKDED